MKKVKKRKSIMHGRDGTCYMCMKIHDDFSYHRVLHEHHVFGGVANRPLSEKYGLKVYLCLDHHETGPEAVHFNPDPGFRRWLQAEGQKAFERTYPEMDFLEIFGKNYI